MRRGRVAVRVEPLQCALRNVLLKLPALANANAHIDARLCSTDAVPFRQDAVKPKVSQQTHQHHARDEAALRLHRPVC